MRTIILSRNPFLYSTRRLRVELDSIGIPSSVVDPLQNSLQLGKRPPDKPDSAEMVIARADAGSLDEVLLTLEFHESQGTSVLNGSRGVRTSGNKPLAIQQLASRGISVIESVFLPSLADFDQAIESLPSANAFVLKTTRGSGGVGVMKAAGKAEARAIWQTLAARGESLILQPFHAEAEGKDQRVIVLAGQALTAIERQAHAGEFRANAKRGSRVEEYSPDSAMVELAIQASKALDLTFAAVDFIHSDDGLKVLEVNASPGLKSVERASGANIAAAIANYCADAIAANAEGDGA